MKVGEIEKLDTNGGYRFVCRDCDRDIFSFGVKPETPVCATCRQAAVRAGGTTGAKVG
jgi:hypothetical protein